MCLQGVGKRVPLDLFRTQGRGGKGLRAIKLNEGDCLSALEVVHPHPASDLYFRGLVGAEWQNCWPTVKPD